MMSPAGSKRKASEGSPHKEENLRTMFRDERKKRFLPSPPPFLMNQFSSDGPLDEKDKESSFRQQLGYEPTGSSKPKVTVDDLDGSLHRTPTRPRKYPRRNSFFIHRDSKPSSSSSSILQDIQTACNWDDNRATDDTIGDGNPVPVSSEIQERWCMRRVSSLDEMTSPTRAKAEETSHMEQWGNATWANADDTQWYSELSSLSFDSKPTLPPPLTVCYSEAPIQSSMTSSMNAPAARQSVQRFRKPSNEELERDAR
jgi:hypothetical protein